MSDEEIAFIERPYFDPILCEMRMRSLELAWQVVEGKGHTTEYLLAYAERLYTFAVGAKDDSKKSA